MTLFDAVSINWKITISLKVLSPCVNVLPRLMNVQIELALNCVIMSCVAVSCLTAFLFFSLTRVYALLPSCNRKYDL